MAGWDGDALAGSMEEALEKQQQAAEERRAQQQGAISAEDRDRKSRQESMRLSRARIEDQLRHANNPAYRAMLERALKALDSETTSTSTPE